MIQQTVSDSAFCSYKFPHNFVLRGGAMCTVSINALYVHCKYECTVCALYYRNRPVQGFGCRTGNSRKLNLNPVCRILPDRKQVFLTENFKLPDLAGNFNFLEYGYLYDRKFLSTKIHFFILTQKTTSIIKE